MLTTVSHKITIGSSEYASGDHSRLIAMRTHSTLSAPVNTAQITLAPPSGLSIAVDDEVVVELGYDGDMEVVYTGVVESVEWEITRVVVRAAGSFRQLVTARLNQFYEKSKAGDIVSDVAGTFDVETGSVEDGLEFAAYALSNGLTAYDSLRQLAMRCGFDFYADADDQLVFAKPDPSDSHAFQYGVNILSLRVNAPLALVTGTEIYGESPSSLGEGSDSYSWLTKKDVKGTAGATSGIVMRGFDPAARTQEAAGQIAEAALDALTEKRTCLLKVLGAPEVHLGDAVEISKMPQDDQNGTFKVVGVQHQLDVKKGFFTLIDGLEK